MVSDLKSDLVMTPSQCRLNVHMMGNPAVLSPDSQSVNFPVSQSTFQSVSQVFSHPVVFFSDPVEFPIKQGNGEHLSQEFLTHQKKVDPVDVVGLVLFIIS